MRARTADIPMAEMTPFKTELAAERNMRRLPMTRALAMANMGFISGAMSIAPMITLLLLSRRPKKAMPAANKMST